MNHVDNIKRQDAGFTIIELMLAMTFIAVLLLSIALTVIQIGTIYNKGLALKEVNQVSRDIASDIRRTTAGALTLNAPTDFVTNAAGGRMCLGNVSYVWNTAKSLQSTDTALTSLRTRYANDTTKLIRFAKVPDISKAYCQRAGGDSFARRDILAADVSGTQEMLESGEHNLGINQVRLLTPPASAINGPTAQSLFTFSYVLSSGNVNTMNATQTACLAPGVLGSDISYCNVQEFTLVFRVGDRV